RIKQARLLLRKARQNVVGVARAADDREIADRYRTGRCGAAGASASARLAARHNLTVLSALAEASVLPSGENASAPICALCPLSEATSCFIATFQSLTVRS